MQQLIQVVVSTITGVAGFLILLAMCLGLFLMYKQLGLRGVRNGLKEQWWQTLGIVVLGVSFLLTGILSIMSA